MIVEFKTIRSSSEEAFEREKNKEMYGENTLSFYKEKDYQSSIYLELDTVVDFIVGKTFFNSQVLECVYARLDNDEWTDNLIISGIEFKKILEYTRNCSIKSYKEILNKIQNENNPTSI